MSALTILSAVTGACAMLVTPMEWPFYRRLAGAILMGVTIMLLAIIADNIKGIVG